LGCQSPIITTYERDDLLALKITSNHYTNISTETTTNIYNFDTENWEELWDETRTSEYQEIYTITSNIEDYFDNDGKILLQYVNLKFDTPIRLYIDYVQYLLVYKLDLVHTTSFDKTGEWQVRWEVQGSVYYTSWVSYTVLAQANFEAISESDYLTRWILQNSTTTLVEDFHDDINTNYWSLETSSNIYFHKSLVASTNYLLENKTISTDESTIDYNGTWFSTDADSNYLYGSCWNGTHLLFVSRTQNEVYAYTVDGTYTGWHFDTGGQSSYSHGLCWDGIHFIVLDWFYGKAYRYYPNGTYTGLMFSLTGTVGNPEGITWDGTYYWIITHYTKAVYQYYQNGTYTGYSFSVALSGGGYQDGITWDGENFWVVDSWETAKIHKYYANGTYSSFFINIEAEASHSSDITWDGNNLWVCDKFNEIVVMYPYGYKISKNYFGSGYTYFQTSMTETLGLKSVDYGSHYTMNSGDYFAVDLQTSSDSRMDLILLKDGVVQRTRTLSPSGNTNFNRHTVQMSLSSSVEFDQLKISSTFEDNDYFKVWDIKTYKYTPIGDSADFYLGSKRSKEIYLTPSDLYPYNLRVYEVISEGEYLRVDTNVNINSTGQTQYAYVPTFTQECRISLFSQDDIYLPITDFHIYVNRSLNNEYNEFALLYEVFDVDIDTYIYIDVYDRFNNLINSFSRLASSFLDLELPVYQLQIKSLMEYQTTVYINTTHIYPLLPQESLYFMLSERWYYIEYTDDDGDDRQFSIYLDSNQAFVLNRSQMCFLSYQDVRGDYLNFRDYITKINDSVIYDNYFYGNIGEIVNITVRDYYNTTLATQIYTILMGSNYIPLTLNVYELKIKNEALEQVYYSLKNNGTAVIRTGYIFSEEIITFSIALGDYSLDYTNYEDIYPRELNFALTDHKTITINTTYHTVYFSMFTYDGLGIDPDLVRFYINNERKDFGRNIIQSETADLLVLDFFNNTLTNETIDASAYSEYNLFVEIYSLIILNQFTYEDIIANITQVGSGVWMTQIIPKQFGLTYRFLPNIEYNITIYFTNMTLYFSRIVNLTDNSHIESFGVATTTPEYPKDVYFSVYTGTGLSISQQLVKLYINGDRADFGFNTIENMIITLIVKDFFNTTLFNQMINTSGIYEYDILINIYSLKVKNEAEEIADYTLKLGALTETGKLFPQEIVEYQLASTNYTLEYVNNEDGSGGTITINLNIDRLYIINSTYYEVYIALYNFYGIVNREEVKFYINSTRADFGFNTIRSNYVNLKILDFFNSTLYNETVNLNGLKEYSIFVRAYTLVVNNLYKNQTITIKITRGMITIERLIEAQGWTEFKLFPNIEYEIISYVNNTIDEEKEVDLDEEYKTVNFGFYEEEVSDIPSFDNTSLTIFLIILIFIGVISLTTYFVYKYNKRFRNLKRAYRRQYTIDKDLVEERAGYQPRSSRMTKIK